MVRKPVRLPLYPAASVGFDGHRTGRSCDLLLPIPKTTRIQFGKSGRAGAIFIPCFPAGTVHPRNAAAVGHLMGSILFSSHPMEGAPTSGLLARPTGS